MKNYFFIACILLLTASCDSSHKKETTNVCISDSTMQANCVYLTSDENDQPVISWCETEKATDSMRFYMAFFDGRNSSFLERINIPLEPNTNLHEEGMPKLAFKKDGTIIAVYEVAINSEKNRFAGMVRYIVSGDKGKSWTTPVSLHSDTSQDNSHSFAAIATLSDGEVGACWLDQSFDKEIGGRPVKFAKTNADNRFEGEITIDSVACQCCRIAISSSEGGKIAVAFRDIISDSIRDMSVSSSNDNGKSFTPAVSFSHDGWVIDGCPHNGPSLALAGNSVYAAWFTGGPEKGVYYCEINDKKETINKQLLSDQGRFIQLCLLKDGSRVLAFNENNKILLNKIQSVNVTTEEIRMDKSMAGYPVIRSFGSNNIVVAWTSNAKVYYRVSNANEIITPFKFSSARSTTGIHQHLSTQSLSSRLHDCQTAE